MLSLEFLTRSEDGLELAANRRDLQTSDELYLNCDSFRV